MTDTIERSKATLKVVVLEIDEAYAVGGRLSDLVWKKLPSLVDFRLYGCLSHQPVRLSKLIKVKGENPTGLEVLWTWNEQPLLGH